MMMMMMMIIFIILFQCSKSCNTGIRTREVKCLDDLQHIATACDTAEKPAIRQTCNTQPCTLRPNDKQADQHSSRMYTCYSYLYAISTLPVIGAVSGWRAF